MSDNSVLIISDHPLFAEAISHVLASEGIAVAAVASNLPDAEPLLHAHHPTTIIVDCNEPGHPQAEILALLENAEREARLVFLSLADNRMIVHHWHRLGDATAADLVSVLRNGASSAAASGVSIS